MNLAPIIIFAYNRPEHLRKTIESLSKNPLAGQSDVFIFSDGPKKQEDTLIISHLRAYLKSIQGFKTIQITEREKNWGLANSVIAGVSEIVQQSGKAIVLEDDMICAPNFLNFMNDALNKYQNNTQIFSISGYTFPIQIPADYHLDVFISPRASSWGWATWQDRWEKADWQVSDYQYFTNNNTLKQQFNQSGGYDLSLMLKKQMLGKVNSWAIRWTYTHFKNQAFCLYPLKSKIHNIGADKSGTHTPKTQKYAVELSESSYQLPEIIPINSLIINNIANFFKPKWYRRILNYWQYKEWV